MQADAQIMTRAINVDIATFKGTDFGKPVNVVSAVCTVCNEMNREAHHTTCQLQAAAGHFLMRTSFLLAIHKSPNSVQLIGSAFLLSGCYFHCQGTLIESMHDRPVNKQHWWGAIVAIGHRWRIEKKA